MTKPTQNLETSILSLLSGFISNISILQDENGPVFLEMTLRLSNEAKAGVMPAMTTEFKFRPLDVNQINTGLAKARSDVLGYFSTQLDELMPHFLGRPETQLLLAEQFIQLNEVTLGISLKIIKQPEKADLAASVA